MEKITEIKVFIDYEAMIYGASESDVETVDRDATLKKYASMIESELREQYPGADVDVDTDCNNPRYSHETNIGLDDGVQQILEMVWDRQDFWVEK